jgi:hypothetical protein
MIKDWSLMNSSLILVMLMAYSSPIARTESPSGRGSSRLCYAFLQNGDLWTVCDEERHKISFEGKATDFAISSDGLRLIVSRKKVRNNHGSIEPPPEVLEVSLKDQTSKVVDLAERLAPIDLHSSCGTIITIARDDSQKGRLGLVYDVANSQLLNASSYKSLHCSSDRHVMGGWNNPDESTLNVRREAREQKYPAARWQDFDVSPSGKYVAYFRVSDNSGLEVCAGEDSSTSICAPELGQQYMLGRINISNSAEIIYESSNGEGCYFRDRAHYSHDPLPGYKLEDPCPSVFHWHSGDDKPTGLEPLGDHPQWITSEIARELWEWKAGKRRQK